MPSMTARHEQPGSLEDRVVVLTSPAGFLGFALRRRLSELGTAVHCASDGEPLLELTRRVRPHVIVHCGVGVIDDVSGEVAPITHELEEVLAVAAQVHGARVLATDSLSSPEPTVDRRRAHLTVLRLGAVYGPGQNDPEALVTRVLDEFLSGATPMLDSGTGLFDWVYIDDVVEAYLRATAHPRPGRVVDVGRGRINSVADIVTMLATMTGRAVPVQFGGSPDRTATRPPARADPAGARRLSWTPHVHPMRGLALTVDWRREHR